MSSFFFDFMQGKLSDLSGSIKNVIDKMVADMLAAQMATALFGADFGKTGGGGSMGGLVGAFGSWFSGLGFREAGGPVSAGRPYIVGEKRAELFIPKTDGYTHSNPPIIPVTPSAIAPIPANSAKRSSSPFPAIELVALRHLIVHVLASIPAL
jgi:hypothetical protein